MLSALRMPFRHAETESSWVSPLSTGRALWIARCPRRRGSARPHGDGLLGPACLPFHHPEMAPPQGVKPWPARLEGGRRIRSGGLVAEARVELAAPSL